MSFRWFTVFLDLPVQRVVDGDGGCHLDLHVDTTTGSLDETAARAEALGARIQRVHAHVDIGTTDQRRAIAWHVALGSRTVHSFPFWTVLADPAGQRYCLIDRDPDVAQHSGPAEA
jgi:hypothetical protein